MQLRLYYRSQGQIGKQVVTSALWVWRDLELCQHYDRHAMPYFLLAYGGSSKKLKDGRESYEARSPHEMQAYLSKHYPTLIWKPQLGKSMNATVFHFRRTYDHLTVKVGATTLEAAQRQLSSVDTYEFTHQTQEPYKHAAFAVELAKCLGPEWQAKPCSDEYLDCNFRLTRETDGLKIGLSNPDWLRQGRWVASTHGFRASIAEERPAAALAKAIQSRVLPGATQSHAAKLATDARERQARQNQDNLRSEIETTLQGHPLRSKVTFQPNCDGTTSVTFRSLPRELLLQILSSTRV
jgi:hypothetical protein